MTEVYNMKQVYSCSDFLNELWQNGPETGDTLVGLPAPSEGGSTQLDREKSTDMLNLLGVSGEAESNANNFEAMASHSSARQGPFRCRASRCSKCA